MENKITATRENLVNDALKLKRNAAKVAEDVRDHASAHVDFVKDQASDSFDQVRNYISENPLYFIAGAFALGLFLGFTRRK